MINEIAGDVDRALLDTRVPIEGSISGQVLKSLRPERVADLSSRMMVSSAPGTAAIAPPRTAAA